MGKVIVVTSGKGGVGKTTTSASFASGLAMSGKKTVIVDFDVGLRNVDLVLGCERRVVFDMSHVMQKKATLNQALIKDKNTENLFILATSQTKDKDMLTTDAVGELIDGLKEMGFEYIVCDSPAGIESGAIHAMHFADIAIVVVNPEISSVKDSDRVLGILDSKTKKAVEGGEIEKHLLITRYNPSRVDNGHMLSIEDIVDILRVKLLGVIPESEAVLTASNQGVSAIHIDSNNVSEAYKDMVSRFLGGDVPMRFTTVKKVSFLKKLFGGKDE